MPVAELFLGALLQVLFEKLGSGLISAYARRERIEKLLKRWTKTLPLIQAYINDAEEKQLTETVVKKWLEDLRDLAYDLDDVLDEIYTEAQIHKSKDVEGRSGKLWKCIPTCQNCTPRAFLFKEKMKSKIEEIADRLEDNERIGNSLNLSKHITGSSSQSTGRLPSTSIVEPHVYGRDEDKEAIYRLMMDNRENVSVIPIVGMGGIGKTTLVQLIYNDAGDFDMKAWVCISEEFDVFAATKIIFHSVTKENPESMDLNMLQERLQAAFSNKKFLLILDDVWNKDYRKWDAFVRPFCVGLNGSKVLVTTRDNEIALMVRTGSSYQVKALSEGDCQSLLAQHALGRNNFDEHPNLKLIGEELARKCKGLPLAAKTLGGLLRSKERDEDWKGVLQSKIWNLPEENNILPVLRLSYHHLPSHLKLLFSYCSIFPKDYEFDKVELVLLWMAEGFLTQSEERKTKEQFGFEYFDELLSRSLFQRLSINSSRFVMHDLVNDLAQFVAGDICYKMDEQVETDDEYKIPEKARHASFLRHEHEVFKKFNGFCRVKGLRTFLPMSIQNPNTWPDFYLSRRILYELLPNLHKSRVLSLSGYTIKEVPDSICKLIHLRYLNLSMTGIVYLPDSLKNLYNLETLSISECCDIDKLPPTMGNLVNLRHLDNSNTDKLKELPVELGALKSLQTLPRIVLSKDSGLGLRDLRDLKLLRGTVILLELQNVIDIDDAKEASIGTKEIEELQLEWGSDRDGSIDGQFEQNVLDALQPHHEKLKKLEIYSYGGMQFPCWIGNSLFSKVFSVSLIGCSQCTCLPPLGLLPELKHVGIKGMPKIKRVGDEFFGKHVVGVPFPKLETLKLDRIPEWEEWSGFPDNLGMQFPSLHELTISECPKLTSISRLSLPVLRSLKLKECSTVVLERLCDLGSLNSLKVESVAGLPHLPRQLVQSMTNVEILEFLRCNELVSLWPNGEVIQHLSKLRRIEVAKCVLFVSLVDEQQQLPPNLEILELNRCESLTLLPNDLRNLRELTMYDCHGITSLPEHAIKRLVINNCNGVESLPSDISTLERLLIRSCPSLKNWSAGNFPSGLEYLHIKSCKELAAVPAEMFPPNIRVSLGHLTINNWQKWSSLLSHVHNFSRLTRLNLCKCDGVEYFPDQGIPPNLEILDVSDCLNLRSLPTQIQNTPSIQLIYISRCRKLESFPRFEFPPNLSTLHVSYCGELKPLSQWGLHRLTSLREFTILGGFEEMRLLADINHPHLFPPSLVSLLIAEFPKLISVSRVLDNLTSLQHLNFSYCERLDDLPGENILERLWHLGIMDCPLLKQRCLKDKGDYWPKIAGIPSVHDDYEIV